MHIYAYICANFAIGEEECFGLTGEDRASQVHLCWRGDCGVISEADANDVVLNLRGLRCPQPVLRAKKALRNVPVGGTLVLECTDPLTVIDVPHFANQTGHSLVSQERRQESKLDLYVFRIVKRH